MTYESSSLVLDIFRLEDALKMSVFEQKEIALTLRHYSQCPVTFTEIEKLCQEIISILNKADRHGCLEPELIRGLKKTGQLLWDHLLTKQAKDKLKAAQISDLILSLDEELIDIPWELLFDGTNFLCLDFNVGRVVRTKEEALPAQYRSFASVLRMLVLANPTNDLKSAYLEGISIKNQFDRKRSNVHIDFKSTHIDKIYVKKNLYDYDIVHFAGHCEFDADNPKNTGWVLNDGRLNSRDILAMGHTTTLPALVFSNACLSAGLNADLIDEEFQERNYSLASAFLFSGVRHYIGAIRKIEDPISLAFSKEFYAQLISGKSMGECIRLSRLKLIKEYGITTIHWASYLLYGDPNFILFKAKPKGSKVKKDFALYKKWAPRVLAVAAAISICVYLLSWLPSKNPNTYILFSNSQKLFQKGANVEVIALCKGIIKKDPLFLAAYPLLADTYMRMGDIEGALKYCFEYSLHSEKRRDKRSLASSYIKIGWLYQARGQFDKALDFYNKAIALAEANKDKLNEALALRKLAVWHIDKNELDSALELLTKSSEINRKRQFTFGHRYNLACDYFDIGLVFANKDDFTAAKEFYSESRALFEKLKLKGELSDYYFNLGEIYLFEKRYSRAMNSYAQGLKIDELQGNLPSLASDYNMIGELYVEMDNFAEAEKNFSQSLSICKKLDLPQELASVEHNLGLLYKAQGKKNKARDHLRQAQEIYHRIDPKSYEEIKKELLDLSTG